ncbi:unnamed protein product [Ceratitis capitata]|uniref:(Mediterranean fruit fly) hypothetical protein n=1 Tax=Ceratitis capitata TaxID=7213 RepID=A0A811VD69_CERCA|nr:unnamed protein product [Ceratitis capitata]
MHEEVTKAEVSNHISHHVSERVKLYEASMKESASPSHLKINKNNNIRCVVPVGVSIVLFTLYLATTAVHSNYGNHGNSEEWKDKEIGRAAAESETQEALNRIKILEKLLEFKDLCTELEVFTKDLRWVNEIIEKDQYTEVEAECEDMIKESMEASGCGESNDGEIERSELIDHEKGNIVVEEDTGNNHSTTNNNGKKEQLKTAKKANTAEPIIYVFALVFIYLLLKAASDINQHYKSQNKGDKRLRRCSLQSYAQTHKQDRRASKGLHRLCTRTY